MGACKQLKLPLIKSLLELQKETRFEHTQNGFFKIAIGYNRLEFCIHL